jgi:hypothetical protein
MKSEQAVLPNPCLEEEEEEEEELYNISQVRMLPDLRKKHIIKRRKYFILAHRSVHLSLFFQIKNVLT